MLFLKTCTWLRLLSFCVIFADFRVCVFFINMIVWREYRLRRLEIYIFLYFVYLNVCIFVHVFANVSFYISSSLRFMSPCQYWYRRRSCCFVRTLSGVSVNVSINPAFKNIHEKQYVVAYWGHLGKSKLFINFLSPAKDIPVSTVIFQHHYWTLLPIVCYHGRQNVCCCFS